MKNGNWIFWTFWMYLLVMNVICFFMYKRDKQNAKDKQERIAEHWLMLITWLGGALGAQVAMRRLRHKTHHWQFVIGVPLAMVLWMIPAVSTTVVYTMKTGPVRTTAFMISRAWHAWAEDEIYISSYKWVEYKAISPTLTRAVVASEDNLFFKHHGFSKRAIQKAWEEQLEKGSVRHGGSTITQQVAKNIFTSGKKTYVRKAREAWYTVLIELFWSKQRIMEVYLNVIEMGDGIYGAEAASEAYFHHSADKLTSEESALIAACLPNPRKYSVMKPGPYIQRRQQQILKLMPKMGRL